ncbi:MAG: hypothetical protein KGZ85_00230 [Ignavibacterium sp.]|nr:hypothetical protein [Ignavibacterium sp.]
MKTYQGQTDKIKKIELESSIEQITWSAPHAAVGGKVSLDVFTHFVGNNSEIKIELTDKSGKTIETLKGNIIGNHYWKQIIVPGKANDELYAEVKLPKLGLSKKSNRLYVYPAILIKNCKWDKKEARRGDVLKLTADVENAYEGTEAEIQIWEHDSDGAHDFIAKFPALVKNKKIEAGWEYEYLEDTDDIPTKEESEKGYNPPEYFFRVIVTGVSADSGLLEFKDWIEINLLDEFGEPMADVKYVIKISDGSEIEGQLDKNGNAKVEDVKPGPYWIYFPDLDYELEY